MGKVEHFIKRFPPQDFHTKSFPPNVSPCTMFLDTKRFLLKVLMTQNVSFTNFSRNKTVSSAKCLLSCYKMSPLLLRNVSSPATKCLLSCYKMSPLLLQNVSSPAKKCLLSGMFLAICLFVRKGI